MLSRLLELQPLTSGTSGACSSWPLTSGTLGGGRELGRGVQLRDFGDVALRVKCVGILNTNGFQVSVWSLLHAPALYRLSSSNSTLPTEPMSGSRERWSWWDLHTSWSQTRTSHSLQGFTSLLSVTNYIFTLGLSDGRYFWFFADSFWPLTGWQASFTIVSIISPKRLLMRWEQCCCTIGRCCKIQMLLLLMRWTTVKRR